MSMNAKAKTNLETLGFNPNDFENCEDFCLLEDLLTNIDTESILSPEEVEALEYADVVGWEDDDIAKKLQEHGIDEDIFEIDEPHIEYLQNKLRSLESNVWDNTIDVLREQHDKMEKIIRKLQEKLNAVNIKTHIKLSEEMWRNNWLELEQLFQELNSINISNDHVVNLFKDFFVSFGNELDTFIEHSTQYLKSWNGITVAENPQESSEENGVTFNHNNESKMLKQLHILKPSLIGVHYNIQQTTENEEHIEWNKTLEKFAHIEPQNISRDLCNEEINLRKLEAYFSDLLNLSVKHTKLQVRKYGILHVLECVKAHRDSWLDDSKEFIETLKKQQALLYLVKIVKVLWDQASEAACEALNYCYKYFHEEVANMKARIVCLEDHKEKFVSYIDEKQNIHPEKLESLASKYFRTEEQSLPDLITSFENELEMAVNQQKMCLLDSKKHISELEKEIAKIQENVNLNMEKLSQISYGFNASLKIMETRKEERLDINNIISRSPLEWSRRLLWVHFLTDPKKLQDMKDQLEANPENNMPGTPSFVNKYPCFTSTPKGEN